MIFNIEYGQIHEEFPKLKEKVSELLNFHQDKATVNYIGKPNPSVPAVLVI